MPAVADPAGATEVPLPFPDPAGVAEVPLPVPDPTGAPNQAQAEATPSCARRSSPSPAPARRRHRTGSPPRKGEHLLAAEPERNLLPTAVEQQLDLLLPTLPAFQAALASVAKERAEAQRAAHERVRTASRARAARGAGRSRSRIAVEPVLPVDGLGAWILLPVLPPAAGAAPN